MRRSQRLTRASERYSADRSTATAYDVSRHYDLIASKYEAFEGHNPGKHIFIGRQFGELLGDLGGRSVLDLGCGQGFFSILSKRSGAGYVLGVDISREQVRIAERNSGEEGLSIDYRRADVSGFSTKRRFDVVIASFVFNYAHTKDALGAYIGTAADHLVPGGRLFAVVCNPDRPVGEEGVLYRVTQASRGRLGDGSRLRCDFYSKNATPLCHDYKFLWTRGTLEGTLKNRGFGNVRWVKIRGEMNAGLGMPDIFTSIVLCAKRLRSPSPKPLRLK